MALGVHALNTISGDTILDESRELLLVGILVIIIQLPHIVSNVLAKDVVTVNLSIEFLALSIVSGETLGAVRNLKTTINSSLHGTEDASSGGGPGKTNIQVGPEWGWLTVLGFHQV